jgi:hypothetical protein
MSLILNGTDGLSEVDGSASTPAIRGTDANTGIFFPAADTIAFAEGGTEVMRIDSSGRVTMPNQPSFYAHLTTLTNFSALAVINFGHEIFDTSNNYNTSNGRFTAPVTGLYQFNASFLIDTSQGIGAVNFRFRVNGTSIPNSSYYSRDRTSGYEFITKSFCWKLTANDYIDVITENAVSVFGNGIGSADNQTHFSGFLVG